MVLVDAQFVGVEQLLRLDVGEQLGHIAKQVELVQQLADTDTAQSGPAVGRLVRTAGPTAQEI